MSIDYAPTCITLEAGQDLSTKQWLFMVQDGTDGQVDPAGSAGIHSTGVLQNKPTAAGQAASIAIAGVTKVLAGGSINPGAKVKTDNTGKAVAADSTSFALGWHIGKTAAASGDIIPVMLSLGGGHFALA